MKKKASKKKIIKKKKKKSVRLSKETKKEIELVHRLRSTPFAYHAHKPKKKRKRKKIVANPDKRKKDWFFTVVKSFY